ncbi:MAG: peptide chain release factor 2 [Oscillospiraceae bacterium]|jgi:peptide chain release factor 2|nr:peptide chain release factor 2 [Oscillospiraceae bacterium]
MIQFEEYKQQLLGLKPKLNTLKEALKPEDAELEASALEDKSGADGFWDDMETAQRVLRSIKVLRERAERYYRLEKAYGDILAITELALEENDESLLSDLAAEFSVFDKKLEQARLETLLSGEYDRCDCIVTLHAGAGGTEAQDWVQMLYRMYMRWGERHGYDIKLVDWLDGDEAGLKSATALVSGELAYGYLKSENGVHRLIRVSPFDSGGRRHTSFAAVEITPQIEDTGDIVIKPEDLRVDTYRSSGAGGQHVNKTESAIRITHIPSGIVVACQQERSQIQNRETAMSMLRSQLAAIKAKEHYDKIEDIKGAQKKIEWGSQIRTYTFMPYTLVKDERTRFETGNVQAVMDGDLDGFINAYLMSRTSDQ